jgi:hypothetical protein
MPKKFKIKLKPEYLDKSTSEEETVTECDLGEVHEEIVVDEDVTSESHVDDDFDETYESESESTNGAEGDEAGMYIKVVK